MMDIENFTKGNLGNTLDFVLLLTLRLLFIAEYILWFKPKRFRY